MASRAARDGSACQPILQIILREMSLSRLTSTDDIYQQRTTVRGDHESCPDALKLHSEEPPASDR